MGRWTWLRIGLVVLSMLFGHAFSGWAGDRYTVKAGDTVSGISRSFGVTVEALKKANSLDGSTIRPKQVLVIPAQREDRRERTAGTSGGTENYVVRQGDSLYRLAKQAGLSVDELKGLNGLNTTSLKVGQTLVLPVQKSDGGGQPEGEKTTEAETAGAPGEKEGTEGETATVTPEPSGKWSTSEERNLFVKVVKTFLGVPYRLGGSTFKGIDCSALVKKIYEIFDITLPRTTREQLQSGKAVNRGELEKGDLVFFKTQRASGMHVGIYIGDKQFVHASYREKEVKVDHLDTPYFSNRFLKGVRVKELERES